MHNDYLQIFVLSGIPWKCTSYLTPERPYRTPPRIYPSVSPPSPDEYDEYDEYYESDVDCGNSYGAQGYEPEMDLYG